MNNIHTILLGLLLDFHLFIMYFSKIQHKSIVSPVIINDPLKFKKTNLYRSEHVNDYSFWIGNHHGIQKIEREAVVSYIDEFMKKYF